MKSSVSPAVAIAAIVAVLAIAGFFMFRSMSASKSAPSQDISANADVSKLGQITEQEKADMKREMDNASSTRRKQIEAESK